MSKFELDERETRKVSETLGKRILGVECPKQNRTGDVCKECDRSDALFRRGTEDSTKEAKDRRAKPSYFLNVQLENGNFVVLKIGKKAAASLVSRNDKFIKKLGSPFGFADPTKGKWCEIEKGGTDPNFDYDFQVLDEDADTVSKEQVDSLNTLERVTKDHQEGLLNLMDISKLSLGQSLKFRVVPSPGSNGKYKVLKGVFYHWRCKEEEILGGKSVGMEEEVPEEFREYMTPPATPEMKKEYKEEREADSKPACFGYFDNADDCKLAECNAVRDACAAQAGYKKVADEFVKDKPKK